MPYKDVNVRKKKHKEYSREHYLRNKEKQIKANSEYKKKRRLEWNTFKCTLKCTKCGFDHPAALDFHHEDPSEKEYNINRLISNGQFKKAEEELKKCIVLCANCHRVHHYEENQREKAKREQSGVSVQSSLYPEGSRAGATSISAM